MERQDALNEYLHALVRLPDHIVNSDLVLRFFEIQETDIAPPSEEEMLKKPEGLLEKLFKPEKEVGKPAERGQTDSRSFP